MDLSKTQNDIINGWINQLNIKNASTDDFEWVFKNHKRINNHIMKSDYSLGTKRNYINLLYVILRDLGHDKLYKTYEKLFKTLTTMQNKEEEKNCLSDKEIKNYITHDELKMKIDELEPYKNDSKKDNYMHLFLSLYYYQPPLRNNYIDMVIKKGDPNKYINEDDDINYMVLYNGKWHSVINKDKVSNIYGSLIIPIIRDELNDIISDSLKKFKRDILFEGYDPINWRKHIAPSIFKPKSVSIDILRSSYINWFYEQKPSLGAKKELASMMRHSKDTAERSYCKVDIDKRKHYRAFNEKTQPKTQPKTSNTEAQPKTQSKTSNTDAQARYFNNNREKVLRNKILRNINNGTTKTIKQETLDKYDITYDKENNIYK